MSARLERQRRRRRRGGAARVIIITLSRADRVRRHRRAERRRLRRRHRELGARPDHAQAAGPGPHLDGLRRRRRRGSGSSRTTSCASRSRRADPADDEATRPSRSRTSASTSHKGVDFEGVVRAAFKNASSGKTLQGGSTLTMQLIRTLYTGRPREDVQAQGPRGEARRGARERPPGPQGQGVDPHEVPQLGARTAPTAARQAVGIQAAARAYFDKRASRAHARASPRCSPACRRRPAQYNPFREPRRRDGAPQRGAAQDGRPRLHHRRGRADGDRASRWSCSRTRTSARSARASSSTTSPTSSSSATASRRVRSGGLRIKTTIDLDLQRKARAAIAKNLNFAGAPSSAIVTIDPRNGYIRTMASSAKYERLAVQPRRRRQAPAGLGVQDHGARRRGARGRQPGVDELRLRRRCSSARSTAA